MKFIWGSPDKSKRPSPSVSSTSSVGEADGSESSGKEVAESADEEANNDPNQVLINAAPTVDDPDRSMDVVPVASSTPSGSPAPPGSPVPPSSPAPSGSDDIHDQGAPLAPIIEIPIPNGDQRVQRPPPKIVRPRKVSVRQHKRAGLIFPTFKSKLKKHVATKLLRISDRAGLYAAAVMEYLVAEMLELAGIEAKEVKPRRKRLHPRHIMLAVQQDEELKRLLKNVIIPGSGVKPYILPQLVRKRKVGKMGSSDVPHATNE